MTGCVKPRWPSRNSNGYGVDVDPLTGRTTSAHRAAWIRKRGRVPRGMEVAHRCRNRWCVNLLHLKLLTHRENTLEGRTIVARWARRKRCSRGHWLRGNNVVMRSDSPGRRCRKCLLIWAAISYRRLSSQKRQNGRRVAGFRAGRSVRPR